MRPAREDVAAGVAALRELGARDVLVSCGADGLVLMPEEGTGWHARLPAPLAGNPTGAGDAVVAALAAGLAERLDVAADGAGRGDLVGRGGAAARRRRDRPR